jgi:hypothetical protein
LGPVFFLYALAIMRGQDKPVTTVSNVVYFTANNSTSNISVALGGMTPPAPRAP